MTDQRHDAVDPDGPVAPAPGAARLRLVLLVVLVVALLSSTATVVWLLSGRRGEAEDVQAERDAVMAQARQFTLRSETFGPDDLDEAGRLTQYRERVEELATARYASQELARSVEIRELLVQQQGAGQSVEILGQGVESLDDDSAVVLITGELTITRRAENGETSRLGQSPFRVVLELDKISGEWLVDTSVTATQAGAEEEQ